MNADLDSSQNEWVVFFISGSGSTEGPDPTFIEFSDEYPVTREELNHKLTVSIARGTPVKNKRVISALFEHNYIGIFFMLQGGAAPVSRYSMWRTELFEQLTKILDLESVLLPVLYSYDLDVNSEDTTQPKFVDILKVSREDLPCINMLYSKT